MAMDDFDYLDDGGPTGIKDWATIAGLWIGAPIVMALALSFGPAMGGGASKPFNVSARETARQELVACTQRAEMSGFGSGACYQSYDATVGHLRP